jgi:hypothetical protein
MTGSTAVPNMQNETRDVADFTMLNDTRVPPVRCPNVGQMEFSVRSMSVKNSRGPVEIGIPSSSGLIDTAPLSATFSKSVH